MGDDREMDEAERLGRRLLDAAGLDVGGDRPWDPRVHDERFWARVVGDRVLGLGESYVDGWWDVESLDEFLARVLLADLRSQVRVSPALVRLAVRSRLSNRQSVRRARHNASAHYDIGNDLYEAMLDRRMVYSCALWSDTATDLDAAQEAKLELICDKLGLAEGMHLLDIGCGWGGLAEYAARTREVKVTGISPAGEQVKVARARTVDLPVTIAQQDYREVTGTFDRIVSVGMVEHVGPRNLGRFFDRCADLLTPEGLMLHHTIGSNESKHRTDPWFDRYIFPGGVVPSLRQLGEASERTWAVEDVHNLGPHYDPTLLAWRANVEAAWDDLPAYDEIFRRMWRYYLSASAAAFRTRNLQVWQVVLSRANRRAGTYRAIRP